ncbi:transporter substrate-binding domain-containing protein [Alkaliphilus hydrothermalis]|uniref:Polar amino acid transport system substrate-binding protein n=1 Tax=Alkaliphilus hydrothermalis TaxID=1482730 RepID=A0ABS2NRZ1_9FIRM|nr:transporter substrate-binding domain-containing protein [Alkaliphilus hydrothermalis]MBM7615703.1 polar amino acid transport system substrate-binding protein [Alkaliphilus hydrothermalis]
MKKIKTIQKTIIALLLMVMVGSLLTGCASTTTGDVDSDSTQNTAVETKTDEIKKAGKLVLGTSADYPPYEFHKVINGKPEIVGFDIEIAKEIAKDLGVELEIKDMKFEGLLAALEAGNVDFVIAGMSATEERKKSVDFSKTYYQAEQTLLVRAEDQDKIQTIEDLAGLTIGAQKTTLQEEIALTKIPGAEAKLLGKITDLVLELKNNKIDGIVLSSSVAKAYEKNSSDLFVPSISFGAEEGVAVAIKKNNEDLVEAINQTLDRLIAEDKINQLIHEATILSEEE